MKAYKVIIIILCFSINIYAAGPRLRPENWGKQILSDKVKNWYKINERLYRSAQPDNEGMKEIEQFGIKSILNLREYHSDEDETKKTNLRSYRIIMNAGEIKDEDIIEALRIIKNSESPILVHCWHGSDRTGTIIAMYRIIEMGWSKENAIDELINGSYGYHSIYDNIQEYIRNVNIDEIKKKVMTENIKLLQKMRKSRLKKNFKK